MLAHGRCSERRRGVGTVIASIIFLFLMIYTVGQLYVFSFNLNDDYNRLAAERFQEDSRKLNEKVSVAGVLIDASGALSITVVNNGGVTAHIVSLWVIDETREPDTHTRRDVDVYIPVGGRGTVTGSATYGNILTVRLVTERGNIITHRIAPASGVTNLRMALDASPPTVVGSHDVGISLFIFNNNTIYDSLYNLRITPATDISYTYSGAGESITLTPPATPTISSLRSGETATFNWAYTINLAAPGKTFTFRGRYTGASTYVSDTVQVATPFGRANETLFSSIVGSVRMVYGSMQWARRNPANNCSNFTWNTNWELKKNDYLVLRVNLTNDGSDNIILDQGTALYMQCISLTGGSVDPFHIVSESAGTISTYAGDVVLQANAGNTVTVHFAVKSAGANPEVTGNAMRLTTAGTYIGFIGIFGTKGATPYGQNIPFQAFVVTT